MVAVGIGLALYAQSLRLTGVAIGKFDREVEQSSGSGGFLLLKFGCFDLISLWGLSGFIRINPIVKPSQNFQNTQTSNLNAASTAALFDFAIELSYGDPGETKRLRIETKPNTNSNPENKELKNDPL